MKRIFSIFLMAFWAFSVLQAAEVTFDFSTAEGINAMGYTVPEQSAGTNLVQAGPKTVNGVTLSATDGATPTRIWNSQGSFSLRIYVDGTITLSVAEGSITGVTVNAANSANFDLLADVGDYSVSGTVGTWTGNASSVTFTHYGSKNAQVASLVVTTSGDDPVDPDPEDPIDPNITKLDSIHHLAALEDGTAFQFTSDVYVNYQWNDYLWVMQLNEEGDAFAGIVYGDTGKEYPLGAVIPAGWTGVKQTYKGLVEAGEPAHFANPKNILDEDYYSPFDCTGYLSYVSESENGWENYKVYFDGVSLSEIDSRGNFTISAQESEDGLSYEATLHGFNKFGIEYPEVDPTEVYGIEGMLTLYNGEIELYPISITSNPGTHLWKVLYEGEDDMTCKVLDTLYVAAVVDGEKGKLVFVTDNVDEIFYDTYIDWGYAEWMAWYPDWIVLDCSENEVFFNAIADAEVLKPGTVKGTLVDRLTNPRLVLNSTPAALEDAVLPTLTLFSYDLSADYITALGNEVGRADGYFFYKDGTPYLCSEQDTVAVKLDFNYVPALEAEMAAKEGFSFALLCVFTLDEAWEENSIEGPARRIHATDEDYFTNYTIHPLAIISCAAVDEISDAKQAIDVKYVTPGGVMSETPQDGVNIVITTHSDGSRTIVKRLGN